MIPQNCNAYLHIHISGAHAAYPSVCITLTTQLEKITDFGNVLPKSQPLSLFYRKKSVKVATFTEVR